MFTSFWQRQLSNSLVLVFEVVFTEDRPRSGLEWSLEDALSIHATFDTTFARFERLEPCFRNKICGLEIQRVLYSTFRVIIEYKNTKKSYKKYNQIKYIVTKRNER